MEEVSKLLDSDEDLQALFKAVGFVVIQFGQAEQSLDLMVASIYQDSDIHDRPKRIPKILEPKLEYLKDSVEKSAALINVRTGGDQTHCVSIRFALQREFGAEPSAETKSLYLKLRNTEPEESGKDLQSSAPAALQAVHHRPTVAVLPFDNLSSSEDNYFADGIAEDIITALSCFHSLLVIARGSSFVYRERKVPERQIAEELGAQFLVRGSVQRSGQRVRINVQLLDAVAGMNLWGHRFDRKLEDVFLLQDEITSTLVSTLAGKVEAARLAHARKAPQERLDAYVAYSCKAKIIITALQRRIAAPASNCLSALLILTQAMQ